MTTRLAVPADLRKRLADEASAMGVPVEWVLRACVEMALVRTDERMLELVLAVEAVRDDPKRVVRMPRVTKPATERERCGQAVCMCTGGPHVVCLSAQRKNRGQHEFLMSFSKGRR